MGCYGHAGLFDPGSIPPGSLLLGPWGVCFPQMPESLRLLNSGSFFPLDFCLFLSSMHLLHLMGEAGPARVLETPLTMCENEQGNCYGLTCTILVKKLHFLLASFALGSLALWGLVLWLYKGPDW